MYMATSKIASDKVLISPILVGNRWGETVTDNDGSSTLDIDYTNSLHVFVGDRCGNVVNAGMYSLKAKTKISAIVTFNSISEDTDIPNDFITEVPQQDLSISVRNLGTSDKIQFALNNSSWSDVTPNETNASGVKTAIIRGVVLPLGLNVLKVRIIDAVGNVAIFTKNCTLVRNVVSMVIKGDIGTGDSVLRHFPQTSADIPFSYSGPVLGRNDRFYGTVDDGRTWIEFIPISSTAFPGYGYIWRTSLNSGTSDINVLRIKLFLSSTRTEYFSTNSKELTTSKFHYAIP